MSATSGIGVGSDILNATDRAWINDTSNVMTLHWNTTDESWNSTNILFGFHNVTNGERDVTDSPWNFTDDAALSQPTSGDLSDNATQAIALVSDGWEWLPVAWEWWQILQLILAIVGITGNFLVILVLFRRTRYSYSTDTLIAALAVADLTTSIFIIPHPYAIRLPDTLTGQVYCRIIHSSVLMWISICASIFTLTTISVERLLAIRYPFTFQRIFTPGRSIITLSIVWIVAVAVNSYSFYVHYVQDGTCVTVFPTSVFQKTIGTMLFLVEYVIPVAVMLTAHSLTIHSLRARAGPLAAGQELQKHALKLMKARHRVLQMLFVVVITFIICWTPDQFGFLVFNLGVVGVSHLFSPLYRCLVVLAFANSCLNPIIYASRNPRFRKALRDVLKGVCTSGSQSVFGGIDESSLRDMNTGTTDVPGSTEQSKV